MHKKKSRHYKIFYEEGQIVVLKKGKVGKKKRHLFTIEDFPLSEMLKGKIEPYLQKGYKIVCKKKERRDAQSLLLYKMYIKLN